MTDKKFTAIEKPENNFLKYAHVQSDLLWGGDETEPVYLSVLIITYKRTKMVRQAVKSVLEQEKVNYKWEIIIMDNDPEDDDLYGYIDSLQDKKIRYYRNRENIGHEGNINRGVELSRGKWVALLHDDDLLVPDYLILIEKYIEACSGWKHPLAYIRTKHVLFSEICNLPDFKANRKVEGKMFIKPELLIESLLRGYGPTYVNSCGSLVNRNAFLKIGGYNEKLNPIGDATLGLIFMKFGYSLYATEQVMGFYRQGENLSTQKKTLLSLIEADYCLREYLYSKNILTKVFGKIFREAQFAEAVDRKISYIEKCQTNDWKQVFTIEEINNIHPYKKSKAVREILRIVRRCWVLIYRQSHLVWREV